VIYIENSYNPSIKQVAIDGFSNANGIEVIGEQLGSFGVSIQLVEIGTKGD